MEEKTGILQHRIDDLPDGREKADALNELSWLLRYDSSDEGEQLAVRAEELSHNIRYERGKAYGKLNRACNRYLKAIDEEVIRTLLEALDYFEKTTDKEEGLSRVRNFLAMVYDSYGDYETALKHAHGAIEAAEKSGYREGEGDGLATLANIYNRLCDFTQSLECFKKSIAIRKELGNDRAMASSLNSMARTHALSGEADKALELYNQSLELRERIDDRSGLPWTYMGMASLHEKHEQFTEAISLYEKSLKLSEENQEQRLQMLCTLGLGRVCLAIGEKQEADYYLHKSLEIAKEMKAKPLLVDVYNALGQYYEAIGNLEKALAHLKRYHELEKEVNNLESRNRLKNQQIVFATEQSRREAEIYQLRNVELKAAYDAIEEKNQEITASIKYAERIQRAVLPPESYMKEIMPEHFLLFLPRDIVSGDYYWAARKNNKIVFTVADCTGHGIPGAFMSMLGISYLNEIVNGMDSLQAGKILNQLRGNIIGSLHQSGREGEQKDGMDMALCVYDLNNKELQYAGAYNPMYLLRRGELEEVKADRMPIAIHFHGDESFSNHIISMEPSDVIYIFSDGFPDQFGGAEGKKYKSRQFKELILEIHGESLSRQRELLFERFEEWKGELPQVDDVTIMGVRF
jgi:serine phosphatase RsbU (regulator of sigma subunit)